jgi:D-beta-D-heptose 7-phosphate kinase/D-beta-D-heptose 1-phosphate adenosyltransferase
MRIAPEAPMPVWDEVRTEIRLGGAANVAHNIKSIGKDEVDVFLAGIVGGGENETQMVRSCGIVSDMCTGRTTMLKHRYVELGTLKYLLRCDNIRKFPEDDVEFFEILLKNYLWERTFDAVIISDYDKGTVTDDVVKLAKSVGTVIVDSKRKDLRMFQGTTVMKLNEQEYSAQVSNKDYANFERFFDYVVVTRGSEGAELRQCEVTKSNDRRYIVHAEKFPVEPVLANDVTGCGDTHTAAMTFSLLKNGDMRNAIRFANACARDVVQKFGTSVM